jgi:hypothetical protein
MSVQKLAFKTACLQQCADSLRELISVPRIVLPHPSAASSRQVCHRKLICSSLSCNNPPLPLAVICAPFVPQKSWACLRCSRSPWKVSFEISPRSCVLARTGCCSCLSCQRGQRVGNSVARAAGQGRLAQRRSDGSERETHTQRHGRAYWKRRRKNDYCGR